MPDDLAKPIATLITEDIENTLSQVTVEGSYHNTLKVERLNETNHEFNNPRHLLAVIDPGDPRRLNADNPVQGCDDYERDYVIHVWVMPSQTDGKPIDETWDAIVGDVVKALCDDDNQSYTRGGYALDTTAGDPDVIGPDPKSLAYLVNIPFTVVFRTAVRNPFQQA
jgi:hypothetical protein